MLATIREATMHSSVQEEKGWERVSWLLPGGRNLRSQPPHPAISEKVCKTVVATFALEKEPSQLSLNQEGPQHPEGSTESFLLHLWVFTLRTEMEMESSFGGCRVYLPYTWPLILLLGDFHNEWITPFETQTHTYTDIVFDGLMPD